MATLKGIFQDKMGMSSSEAEDLYDVLQDRYGNSLDSVEETLDGTMVSLGLRMIPEIDDSNVRDLEDNQAVQNFAEKYGIDTEAAARITIFMQENGEMLGYNVDTVENAVNSCNSLLYGAENGSFTGFGVDLEVQEQKVELQQDNVPQAGQDDGKSLRDWFNGMREDFNHVQDYLGEQMSVFQQGMQQIGTHFQSLENQTEVTEDREGGWLAEYRQRLEERRENSAQEENESSGWIDNLKSNLRDIFNQSSQQAENNLVEANNQSLDNSAQVGLSQQPIDRNGDPLDNYKAALAARLESIAAQKEEMTANIHQAFEGLRDTADKYITLATDAIRGNAEAREELGERASEAISNVKETLGEYCDKIGDAIRQNVPEDFTEKVQDAMSDAREGLSNLIDDVKDRFNDAVQETSEDEEMSM